jgi:membrane protein DedA with SNARE-associated domain
MRPTTPLAAFVLFAIVTVEFGGWSLLGYLTGQESLTPFQEQFFRAGHAHAGVLLILALVYLILMDRTRFSGRAQLLASITLLIGVLLQSGGFFLHFAVGEEGEASAGTWMTRSGAILLAAALITLGVGLLRSRRDQTE